MQGVVSRKKGRKRDGELETLMSLSNDLGMLDRNTFEKLYPMQEEISKLLRGLITSLSKPQRSK